MFTIIRKKYHAFLRLGTEYFGLDLKYFASGGFWTGLGQFVNGFISFGLVIAFANLLPKEIYGLYRYILSLGGILTVFSMTGMNTAAMQAVATGNEGVLKRSVKYQLKWNLMMMAALFGLAGYYLVNGNKILSVSLFVLGIFSPLTSALNTYGAFLEGKREFKLNNIFSMLSAAFYAAGIITVLLISKEVVPLIIAYSLTTFAANLFFYFKTLKLFNLEEGPSVDALAYGRKLTYMNFMGPIVGQIDNIILSHFWGPIQLAVYSLAMAVPDRFIPFVKSFVDIGFPKLAQRTAEEINKVFWRRIFQGVTIGILIAVVYILAVPFVFKYLMPKYLEAVFYSQILAASFIFALPNRYVSTIFSSQKLAKIIFQNSILQSTIRIGLYIILGIFGGIMGLVLAQVINSFLSLIINIAVWKFRKIA